jgi:4-hydroxythreonine-4-phosphate dehydrogenase
MNKPIIGVTMGDPSGIGPEIALKVLSKRGTYKDCRPFVIGDPKVIREASKIVGRNLEIKTIQEISEARFLFSSVEVLCPKGVDVREIEWGRLDPAMGKAAALCLEKAFRMALEKKIDGVVSAPLNKEAFHRAGYPHIDELEFLGEITNSPDPFVVGVMDSVWTVTVTSHIPFREIVGRIKKDRILRFIHLMNQILKKVGIADPKIAVAALNVHGGEGGLIGGEEIEEIKPAIEEAQRSNIKVQGPFPADTIFATAMREGFDAVVGMYHDQVNIARKLSPTRKGATLYMGLPVTCGTTAHGTAFDIAGKGIADPGSLKDALKYTARLSS